jgi:hypothetical protein
LNHVIFKRKWLSCGNLDVAREYRAGGQKNAWLYSHIYLTSTKNIPFSYFLYLGIKGLPPEDSETATPCAGYKGLGYIRKVPLDLDGGRKDNQPSLNAHYPLVSTQNPLTCNV